VVEQYKAIGGKSPFNELTLRQAKALSESLEQLGVAIPVVCGFLHARPFIRDTLAELVLANTDRLIVLVMAPQRSQASHGRYLQALEAAMAEHQSIPFVIVDDFHKQPLFIEAVGQRVKEKIRELNGEPYRLIFTAHSIPQSMPDSNSYDQQIRESAQLVADFCQHNDFRVAYQSRSGNPRDPWLGPDVSSAIEQAKSEGINNVIVVPIGFLCDHVEVLYDLDILALAAAEKSQVRMLRAQTVSDQPKFIQMLSQLVGEKLKQPVSKP
jgi:ferrochelatase